MRNSQKVMEIFTNRGYNVKIDKGVLTIFVQGLGFSQSVKYLDDHSNIDYVILKTQCELTRIEEEADVDVFKIKFLKQLLSRKIETWVDHYLKTGNEIVMFAVPEKNQSLVHTILYEIIEKYVTINIFIKCMEGTEMGCDVTLYITNK